MPWQRGLSGCTRHRPSGPPALQRCQGVERGAALNGCPRHSCGRADHTQAGPGRQQALGF